MQKKTDEELAKKFSSTFKNNDLTAFMMCEIKQASKLSLKHILYQIRTSTS